MKAGSIEIKVSVIDTVKTPRHGVLLSGLMV
jgi:hypothetical protein